MATVHFREFSCPLRPGVDLLSQLLQAQIPVIYLCMAGSCRACRVQVVSGMEHLEPRGPLENLHRLKDNERLACQCRALGTGDVVLEQ